MRGMLLVPLLVGLTIGTPLEAGYIHVPPKPICPKALPADAIQQAHGAKFIFIQGGQFVAFNCGGLPLRIKSGNRVRASGCASVTIVGDHNQVEVNVGQPTTITVSGNDNDVTWDAPKAIKVTRIDSGSGNSVAPGAYEGSACYTPGR